MIKITITYVMNFNIMAPPPSIELEPPALQTGVQANYTRAAKMEDPEGLKPSTS